MKTYVMWTHYDCEVYATLHPTQLDAYRHLASNWLDGCNEDDCGHDENIQGYGDVDAISEALEYHYEELSYMVEEHEVPMGPLPPPDPSEVVIVPDKQVMKPIVVSEIQAGGLLEKLEHFSEDT
jgi:hypothetical protein